MDYYVVDRETGEFVIPPQTDRSRKTDFGPRKAGTGTKIGQPVPPAAEKINPKSKHISAARRVDMGAAIKPKTGTRLVKGPITSYTMGKVGMTAQTPFVNFAPGGSGKSVATEQFTGTLRYDRLIESGNYTNCALPQADSGAYAVTRAIHPVFASATDFLSNQKQFTGTNKKPVAYRGTSEHIRDVQNGGKGGLSSPFGGTGHQRAAESVEADGPNSPYVRAVDSTGWTVLHACAVNGYTDLLQLLIEKGKMDPKAKTHKGASAITISKKRGWTDIVDICEAASK